MQHKRPNQKLSRKEWSWIIFVPLFLTVITVGHFLVLIPVYILVIFLSYLLTNRFPTFFNRERYWLFVLKVIITSIALFCILVVPYWLYVL